MAKNCSSNFHRQNNTIANNNSSTMCAFELYEDFYVRTIVILICTANIPLLLTAIIGNSLVLAAIWKTPSLRKASDIFLSGLAVSDLVVGLLIQPLFVTIEIIHVAGTFTSHYCTLQNVYKTFGFTACGVSFATVTFITLDRFFAVQYHMRYPSIVTIPRVACLIALTWLLSALLSSLQLWSFTNPFRIITITAIAVCFFITTTVHVNIYRIVRRHQSQILAHEEALQRSSTFNITRFKKSAKNTFFVYCFILICYTPYFAVSALEAVGNITVSIVIWAAAFTLVFSNSAFNPFLYCWRIEEIRASFMKILKLIVGRNRTTN